VFDNASGVFKGDDVKLAGVNVGRVTGTEIQNGHGIVHFTVDDNVKLTSDSIVAIRWRNVLGLRFLYLYPGSGQGRPLHDGSVVGLSQTEDAGDIGQFLNELGPILQAIDPQKANEFLDAVNTALGGSEVAVRQLLNDGAALAGQLGNKDKQIGQLVGNSSQIMAAYASQNGNLGRILDDLNTLGGKLASITPQVNSLITNFADVQQRLSHVMTASRGNIDASLSELNSVLGTLAGNRANLEHTLCSTPMGVAPYYETSSWGQWFNVRVTAVTFRDNNGRLVAKQGELPNERGGPAIGGPVVTCGGAAIPKSPGAPTLAPAGTSRPSGSGPSSFLQFVTQRSA
jgi:phospholipid/cholesterol/gamma-HCH transport system substrate-binding protein